jgi:hypothetical protein
MICGNTCHEPLPYDDDDKRVTTDDFRKKTEWLNNCTVITKLNEVIHDCKEINCNTMFEKNGKEYVHGWHNHFDWNEGIFIHDDCWTFVKQKTGMKLTYSDLPIFNPNAKSSFVIPSINYGKIRDYWGQDFKFHQVEVDKNEWICESPLHNAKNAKRIHNIINQLKIRNDVSRKSPSASATFYPERTIKIGNDGNFWIIKSGKWTKMRGTIITQTIEITEQQRNPRNKGWKVLQKTQQIGTYSNLPMFVKNFAINGKTWIFTIISLDMEKN